METAVWQDGFSSKGTARRICLVATTLPLFVSVTALAFGETALAGCPPGPVVEAGGQIRIMGEYYRNVETPHDGLRWPASWILGRPVGNGPDIVSGFGWDGHGCGLSVVSQWTRLHVKAD
ncbi:MAG: hypothetical protein QG656_877, partial [Candidatus Hydrogenedentes bacterium]|nr:hypothetical protein [Candidatus Hydrogenedentota bacterium]